MHLVFKDPSSSSRGDSSGAEKVIEVLDILDLLVDMPLPDHFKYMLGGKFDLKIIASAWVWVDGDYKARNTGSVFG